VANGHATAGQVPQGQSAAAAATGDHGPAATGPSRTYVFAQAVREAGGLEHAAVSPARLAASPSAIQPLVAPPPVPQPRPAPSPAPAPIKPAAPRAQPPGPGADDEPRTVNHPALESLRFPKTGVSRQWQEFLDQLAANQ
jgi:hypothetical protein